MEPTVVDRTLEALATVIREQRFRELETDTLELKPVPPSGGDWRERYKTLNAFLNTKGGVLLPGIKEEGKGGDRRYVFKGWQPEIEEKRKTFSVQFMDRRGVAQDLLEWCLPGK